MSDKRERYKLPVAVFMILKKWEEILLLKRQNTWRLDGYFSIPAGSLDDGEEIAKAAIRECQEEVGVDVKEEDMKLANVLHCLMDGNKWINFLFITEKREWEPTVCEPHKHSEVKRCSVNELPENMIPYVKKSLDDYFANGQIYSQFWRND